MKIEEGPLARTGNTPLTDNELLLLDAICSRSAISTDQLHGEDYCFHMNTNWGHSLSDEQVDETLESLRTRQMIAPYDNDFEEDDIEEPERWHVISLGLELWEQERCPLWDRYIGDSLQSAYIGSRDPADLIHEDSGLILPVLTICSPNYLMIEPFLSTVQACGIWEPLRNSDRVYSVKNDYIDDGPGWGGKIFPVMHFLSVPTVTEDDDFWMHLEQKDWDEYEERRIWWRTVSELDTLRKKLRLMS